MEEKTCVKVAAVRIPVNIETKPVKPVSFRPRYYVQASSAFSSWSFGGVFVVAL